MEGEGRERRREMEERGDGEGGDVEGVNGGGVRNEMSRLVVHLLHGTGTWTTTHGLLAFLPFSSSDFLLPLQV